MAVFAAPKEKVWSAAVAVIGIGFPIQVIEKDSGLISTRPSNMTLPASQWALGCENPDDFINPWNALRMDLRLLAEEREPGKTQITLVCQYEANKQSVYPSQWIAVASSGKLERDLLKKIQSRLDRQH
ncbi:hypothetical protein [Geothrix sp. PMB-07]|uniref:hypothetical protein n=1 Tax=Geothrix sp. PMB-07 TaxID=3068640 RepID=UPI002740F6AD|nr:hypothetical protein [Geothrix sp. PMB-07]WLT32394.1 hypothetical protein Q9293_03470 [Geothrix sp. PMB-07]